MSRYSDQQDTAKQMLDELGSRNVATSRDRLVHALLVGATGSTLVSQMLLGLYLDDHVSFGWASSASFAVAMTVLYGLWLAASHFSESKPRDYYKKLLLALAPSLVVTLVVVFPYINYNHYTNPDLSVPVAVGLAGIVVGSTPSWIVSLYTYRSQA